MEICEHFFLYEKFMFLLFSSCGEKKMLLKKVTKISIARSSEPYDIICNFLLHRASTALKKRWKEKEAQCQVTSRRNNSIQIWLRHFLPQERKLQCKRNCVRNCRDLLDRFHQGKEIIPRPTISLPFSKMNLMEAFGKSWKFSTTCRWDIKAQTSNCW